MDGTCEVCGDEATKANPVLRLSENRVGSSGIHEEIRLCWSCVSKREVASWPKGAAVSRKLRDRLDQQQETPHGRFVYLEDGGRIHLIRMRPEWLDEHAAATSS